MIGLTEDVQLESSVSYFRNIPRANKIKTSAKVSYFISKGDLKFGLILLAHRFKTKLVVVYMYAFVLQY